MTSFLLPDECKDKSIWRSFQDILSYEIHSYHIDEIENFCLDWFTSHSSSETPHLLQNPRSKADFSSYSNYVSHASSPCAGSKLCSVIVDPFELWGKSKFFSQNVRSTSAPDMAVPLSRNKYGIFPVAVTFMTLPNNKLWQVLLSRLSRLPSQLQPLWTTNRPLQIVLSMTLPRTKQ